VSLNTNIKSDSLLDEIEESLAINADPAARRKKAYDINPQPAGTVHCVFWATF
jgi:hypothetical protein